MQSIATQCSATREVWLEGRYPPSPDSSPNCSQVSSNVNCHQNALQCNAIGNNAPPRFQIATLDRATPFITWLVTAGTTMLQLLQSVGDHTWQPCLILVKGLWKFISFEVKDDQNGWRDCPAKIRYMLSCFKQLVGVNFRIFGRSNSSQILIFGVKCNQSISLATTARPMIARSRGKGAIVATWRLFCLFPEPAPVVVASALFPSKLPKLSVCRGGRGNLITSTDRCFLLKLAVGRVFPDFENHALPCLDSLVPHWHFGPLQKEHNNEGFSL